MKLKWDRRWFFAVCLLALPMLPLNLLLNGPLFVSGRVMAGISGLVWLACLFAFLRRRIA